MTYTVVHVHDPLPAPQTGRVLSAHARAVNLILADGQVLSLLHRALGNGPGAVLVAGEWPLPWRQGDEIRINGSMILGPGLALDTARAPRWAPPPVPLVAGAQRLRSARQQAVVALLRDGSLAGLLPAALTAMGLPRRGDPLHDMALPGLAALREHRWADAVRRLAGLGPGLTPSGDDLLAGYTVTLHRAQLPAAAPMSAALTSAATTPLSLHFLRWAALGVAGEHQLTWIDSVLAGSPGPLDPVLAHGATSGADWAAGALLALDEHPIKEDSHGDEAV